MPKEPQVLEALAGAILADKYRLIELLGSGGMGFVYQAEQLGLGRSVAVKLLRRELIATRFDWFRAEAMAASRINHPHAVAIYDFGVTDDGIPYLVMEHLRGCTLSSLIEAEPLSPERIVALGAQVLSALDEAHACGVVHCDLTGDNVIVERLRDGDDFAKVIDFGLARLFDSANGSGNVVGTAEYVAPELIRGEPIDPRTDLYAVGILLYEMIVGRTPFAGSTVDVILEGHLGAIPDDPHDIIPACPPALSALVLEALAKDPNERPHGAAEMRDALLATLPESAASIASPASPGPAVMSVPPRRAKAPAALRRSTRLDVDLTDRSSSLIGRQAELDHLMAFCRAETGPSTLAVTGPRGIGKGRLTSAAKARLAASVKFFRGGADPSGLKTSWYPVLAILEAALGLEGPPTYEQLSVAIARCGLPDRDVPGLAEIFAIEGPASKLELAVRRREAHAAAVRALLAVKRRHPRAALLFSDIDRYDLPSSQVVCELARRAGEVGLKVIVTSENEPELGTDVLVRIELAGLPPQWARELAVALAGQDKSVPSAPTIHSVTAGSPAAIEQLAGWLRLGNRTSDVPSLLVDLVSIRVNRLPAPARRVLQTVAIHGTVAPRRVVEASLGDTAPLAVGDQGWTGLLVVAEDTLTIPTDLVASVISACTPADVRRRLHRRALEALGDTDHPGIRGHHAEHAGEHATAYELFVAAGNDSVRRFDDPGAAVWYGRAVSVARDLHLRGIPDASEKVIDSSVLLAEVLRCANENGLARGVLEEALGFDPTPRQRALLDRSRGMVAAASGQLASATELLQTAIASALKVGERNFLCQCYLDLVKTLDSRGRSADATRELEESIDVVTMGEGLRSSAGPDRLWRLGFALAERYHRAGSNDQALGTAQAALALAGRAGNNHARGRVRSLLAQICEALGERGQALRHRAKAVDEMRELGDRRSTAELLIDTARASRRAASESDGTDDSSESTASSLRLAGRLAAEIGWDEGVRLSREGR